MPLYEYQCEACGAHHEVMRKISDPLLRKCPACGRLRLKRVLSAPVFRLKGGGWYETDFKSDKEGRRNIAGDEGKAETRADDKAGGAGEAQPSAAESGKAGAETQAKPEATPQAKPEAKPGAKTESKPGAGDGAKAGSAAAPSAASGHRRPARRATPAPPVRGPGRTRGSRGRR